MVSLKAKTSTDPHVISLFTFATTDPVFSYFREHNHGVWKDVVQFSPLCYSLTASQTI